MGINFSHSEAQWAYSGFHHFRERLASEIGIDLNEMIGFGGSPENLSWDTVDSDIKLLLDHSDCDGSLSPEKCKKIAPILRVLVNDWPEDSHNRINAILLAEGMEECYKSGETLRFH
jgi:hypothetical protein